LAPTKTLPAPEAIATILRGHSVDDTFIDAEVEAMGDVRLAPTNNRSVVGVMNEFAFRGELAFKDSVVDLYALSLDMAHMPLGPLSKRTGLPDLELAAVVRSSGSSSNVVPFPRDCAGAVPSVDAVLSTAYQLKITLLDTRPAIWRRVLVGANSTLDEVHDVIQAAFGWWNYHLHEFDVGRVRYGPPEWDDDFDPPRDEGQAPGGGVGDGHCVSLVGCST
jgi:hypothetical protein